VKERGYVLEEFAIDGAFHRLSDVQDISHRRIPPEDTPALVDLPLCKMPADPVEFFAPVDDGFNR
jgi:hypothetical protein